jgi:preprotein translocase subunit YajC
MYVNLLTVLLQAGGPQGSSYFSLIFMVGMIAVMYFFMIRPQAKRAKEQKKFTESIGTGDHIITTAGIHGRINRTNEDGTLQLEIGRNTYMVIERSAISMEMTAAYRKKTGATGTTVTTASTTNA